MAGDTALQVLPSRLAVAQDERLLGVMVSGVERSTCEESPALTWQSAQNWPVLWQSLQLVSRVYAAAGCGRGSRQDGSPGVASAAIGPVAVEALRTDMAAAAGLRTRVSNGTVSPRNPARASRDAPRGSPRPYPGPGRRGHAERSAAVGLPRWQARQLSWVWQVAHDIADLRAAEPCRRRKAGSHGREEPSAPPCGQGARIGGECLDRRTSGALTWHSLQKSRAWQVAHAGDTGAGRATSRQAPMALELETWQPLRLRSREPGHVRTGRGGPPGRGERDRSRSCCRAPRGAALEYHGSQAVLGNRKLNLHSVGARRHMTGPAVEQGICAIDSAHRLA